MGRSTRGWRDRRRFAYISEQRWGPDDVTGSYCDSLQVTATGKETGYAARLKSCYWGGDVGAGLEVNLEKTWENAMVRTSKTRGCRGHARCQGQG